MPKRKPPPRARASRSKRRALAGSKKHITRGAKSPLRTGLPTPAAVISEETFTSPTGKVYRILKTNERDASDEAEPPQGTDSGNGE